MDVPRGYCWYCQEPLPQQLVHCKDCPVAEYCTAVCRDDDIAKHTSVECQLYGPKTCSNCGKKDTMKVCARCNDDWYCTKECQRKNWDTHKKSCNEFKKNIKNMAGVLGQRHNTIKFGDSPYYFGNILARDYLQLDNNEWSDLEVSDKELTRDYHIFSAGCGDLRNMVLTAGSLPARYQGKLHFTLNDFDAFVMARNVLFLYMLVRFAETEGIESSLTTIWYSLHIKEREYDLIKTSLDELIKIDAKHLQEVTQGLVSVLDTDLLYLSQVWAKWRSLQCQRNKKTSINLRKQRKDLRERGRWDRYLPSYLAKLSYEKKEFIRQWFDHALFLPTEAKETAMPFDNPTITGKQSIMEQDNLTEKDPKDHKFVYCNKSESWPFIAWNRISIRENAPRPCPSPMVTYHNYVTKLLQKVKHLILQGRLHVQVSLANFMEFPSVHQCLQTPKYDRIFTSNLADYAGVAKLLQTFKPLLNPTNIFSVIITETNNWIRYPPRADLKFMMSSPEYRKCKEAYFKDTGELAVIDTGNIKEYYMFNNTSSFLMYLRAQIMGGGIGIRPLRIVPKMGAVMQYHGMQMRDFRKKLNRLVPFQYRVNDRDLTMMNGDDRAVEWCLPHADGKI